MQRESALRVALIVAGMHLSPQFGLSVERIEADGFEIADRIEMLLASDTPEAVAKSIGLGVLGFAQSYVRLRPTILLLLGDRFEMLLRDESLSDLEVAGPALEDAFLALTKNQ